MELTVAQIHVGKISGCIGGLQSIAWLLLSVPCLAWHFGGLTFTEPTTYQASWEIMTYSRFLSKDVVLSSKSIVTPTTIAVFCFFYVFLCAAWFSFSCLLAWGINHNHARLPLFFRLWGYNIYMITVVDIVLLIMLSLDFDVCMNLDTFDVAITIMNEGTCTNVFVPVMTIVARGFVLMLVNVGFCIYTINIGKELGIKVHQGHVINIKPYGVIFSSGSTIPRAVVQQTPNPYQQYLTTGSNPHQQPQSWSNNPPTSPTRSTGAYPPQYRKVH